MPTVRFDVSTISLSTGQGEAVLAQRVLCTKFGLVAGALGEFDDPAASNSKERVACIDMARSAAWSERPQQPGVEALSLEHRTLPRALLWSAAIRGAIEAHRADAFVAHEVEVAPDLDEAGAADAVRACAMSGLMVASLNGGELPEPLAAVVQWQGRRPWAELRTATGETLIAAHARLPASARFGRRYVSHADAVGAPTLNLLLGDEGFVVELDDLGEFLGQQEYELVWGADGTLALDLLVDGSWRPLPQVVLHAAPDGANHAVSQVFRQLSEWREVGALVQVRLLETLAS